MSRFVPVDRQTGYLLPPSVEDWLPEDHLARFVVEVIAQMDLSELSGAYAGRGMAAHHPEVLLGLLVYGYATGVFSSRKLERATYDSVAFRYIAANTHPDHDTLATFRKRFASQIEKLFVQVLLVAQEMKLVKLGRIALDGTKVKANASRHRALSYGHIGRIEAQLHEEVQQLMEMAENADRNGVPDGMDVPAELARREARLKALAEAKAKLEARAQERFEQEQQEYEARVARREAQRKDGKKPRGKDPKPPQGGARERDQINLTDEESRIMPVSSGGFEQGYNAQAAVDVETMLIVGTTVTQHCNDKRQIAPMVDVMGALPGQLGQPEVLLADAGYFSAANVATCEAAHITPLIAIRRDAHHLPLMERFADDPAQPESTDPIIRMTHQLKTKAGRALYGLRKNTVEPVFGIIKHVMGFRQFSLRGLSNVTAEWSLVALAWNIKRMSVLRGA
jgi:transposase